MMLGKAFAVLMNPEYIKKAFRKVTFPQALLNLLVASMIPATLLILIAFVAIGSWSPLIYLTAWLSCVGLSLFFWAFLSLLYWTVGKLFEGKGSLGKFALAYSLPYSALVVLSSLALIPPVGGIVLLGLFFWNLIVVLYIYKGVMRLSTEKALLGIAVQFVLAIILIIILFALFVIMASSGGLQKTF